MDTVTEDHADKYLKNIYFELYQFANVDTITKDHTASLAPITTAFSRNA